MNPDVEKLTLGMSAVIVNYQKVNVMKERPCPSEYLTRCILFT
jgi:hypothetical protein